MSAPTPSMPPLPPSRDEELSFSEMVPIRSSKINVLKSPFLIFGVITAIVCVVLFMGRVQILTARTAQDMFNASVTTTSILVAYILFVMLWIVHSYSRTDRSLLFYIWPLAGVYVLLQYCFSLFVLVFRQVLPGNLGDSPNDGFITTFIGMFFGAGLCEEVLKATPALLSFFLLSRPQIASSLPPKVADLLRIRGPLDGLLMCTAAGAMFIFLETAFEYVPKTFIQTFQQNRENPLGAWASALMLLIPRTIQAYSGHMGWNGIAGYFIGLAVIRPKAAWKLLVIGILVASLMHGLWNSVSKLHFALLYVIGIATVVGYLACLLKARQIQMAQFGAPADTGGSILVGARPGAAPVPPPVPAPAPAYAPPPPSMPTAPAPSVPAGPPVAATPAPGRLALVVAGKRWPLEPGGRLDLAPGLSAEITQHPQNPSVIGLRNLGEAGWNVTLPDTRQQRVEPQKNIRLSPGLRIEFGNGTVGLVAAV